MVLYGIFLGAAREVSALKDGNDTPTAPTVPTLSQPFPASDSHAYLTFQRFSHCYHYFTIYWFNVLKWMSG